MPLAKRPSHVGPTKFRRYRLSRQRRGDPRNRPQIWLAGIVEKSLAIPRDKCGGRLDGATLIALNHMVSVVIGIAD